MINIMYGYKHIRPENMYIITGTGDTGYLGGTRGGVEVYPIFIPVYCG